MFVIKKNEKPLNEANEKALMPVCTVHVQKIFALLHAKAVAAAAAKGVLVENTAADGNDAKTAVFHSAGEHMIVARAKEDGKKISKKDALEGLKEYIGVFCGEDVKKALKDNECFPLPEGSPGEVSESSIPSFSMFLSESAGLKFIMETDDADDDTADNEAQSDEDSDAAGSEEDADEMEDAEDDDEGGESDFGDGAGEGNPDDEAEEVDPGDEEIEPGKEKLDSEKDGWYVLYGLKIKGLKETTVQDALEQWGSNFLKGFGVKLGSSWGGMGSEVHTVGSLVKGLKGLFGVITDPDQLANRIQSQIEKKYPKLSDVKVQFRDKKTLISELDKNGPYAVGWPDGKNKQKINQADYSLYIHVEDDDLRKPFLNRKVIANIVTMQIKGLFSKFKNIIKADDVIYIKGKELTGRTDKQEIAAALKNIPSDTIISNAFFKVKTKSDNPDETVFQSDENIQKNIKSDLNNKFDKAGSNKNVLNDEVAQQLIKMWREFSDGKPPFVEKDVNNFVKKYKEKYDAFRKTHSDMLEEDEYSVYTAYDIMTNLFENTVDPTVLAAIFEDDDADGDPEFDDEGESGQDETSNNEDIAGDDNYIIPMPGVKYDNTDKDGIEDAGNND